MNRQAINQELVDILQYLIEMYPELRFTQILYGFDFIDKNKDEFYTEPDKIRERVIKRLNV